eukprot:TRINITY_DN13598_c0_g1_i1.p1 TRINITY_DN13598_c0_g1~~TRINITY_DN13598_c0_g1_i1.p1  ORF type:complete len:197 (+),score=4.26 TRINITY_DN13598_c0_g1_i1:90-593(+)
MATPPVYQDGCAGSCAASQACLLCSAQSVYKCFEETLTSCCGCRNGTCTGCASSSSCMLDPSAESGWVCKGKFEINLAEILVLAATGLVIVGGITLCAFLIYRRQKRKSMPEAIVVSSGFSGYGSTAVGGEDPYSNYDTPPKTFYSNSERSASTYDVGRKSRGYERA